MAAKQFAGKVRRLVAGDWCNSCTTSFQELAVPSAHSLQLAVVTGSTSGIGLGIAHSLAKNGAAIVLNGFGSDAEIKSVICLVAIHWAYYIAGALSTT